MRTHHVPLGFVFRSRAKDEKAQAADKAPVNFSKQPRDPQAPKGRPTPKRSEAQSQRRSVANTSMTRKEAAKRQREERRSALERPRHLGSAEAAIAFAEDVFWRRTAPVSGNVE